MRFTHIGTYDENLRLPQHMTLSQYRRVIFRPDAHFLDGHIVPRTLGDSAHARAIGDLLTALHSCSENLDCCISLRLQVAPSSIRVCDLVILATDAPYEAVPSTPPLLCIEVLTQGQSPADELDTLADYFAMGVPNIWLIDPIRRAAYTFGPNGLQEADLTHLTVPGTPIHIDLTAVFAKLDKKLAQKTNHA